MVEVRGVYVSYAHLQQFVYRIEGENEWWSGLPLDWVQGQQAGEQACYAVRAHNIVTGEETLWPQVCFEAGPLPQLGTDTFEVADQLDVALCSKPPQGMEQRWCELNGPCCTDSIGQLCRHYRDTCAPPSPLPAMMDPSGAGAGGADGPSDSEDAEQELDPGGSGCTCGLGGAGPSAWLPSLLALAWLRRRRRS